MIFVHYIFIDRYELCHSATFPSVEQVAVNHHVTYWMHAALASSLRGRRSDLERSTVRDLVIADIASQGLVHSDYVLLKLNTLDSLIK